MVCFETEVIDIRFFEVRKRCDGWCVFVCNVADLDLSIEVGNTRFVLVYKLVPDQLRTGYSDGRFLAFMAVCFL